MRIIIVTILLLAMVDLMLLTGFIAKAGLMPEGEIHPFWQIQVDRVVSASPMYRPDGPFIPFSPSSNQYE